MELTWEISRADIRGFFLNSWEKDFRKSWNTPLYSKPYKT